MRCSTLSHLSCPMDKLRESAAESFKRWAVNEYLKGWDARVKKEELQSERSQAYHDGWLDAQVALRITENEDGNE